MPIINNLEELNAMVARLQAVLPRLCPRRPETLMYAYYTHEGYKWKFYIGAFGPNDGYGDPIFWGYGVPSDGWMAWSLAHWRDDFQKGPLDPRAFMIIELLENPTPIKDLLESGTFSSHYPPPRFVEV